MKYRLDQLLLEKQLVPSREKAKAMILSGNVLVNNQVITKAGYSVDENSEIRLKQTDQYVSRGGHKLEKALKDFRVDVKDLIVIDIGASTGGFTDCLLQNGAKFIYSVDVGYNQLDYRLRTHSQVKVIENQNARYLTPDLFDQPIDLAVIDVSFISLTKILESVLSVLSKKQIIALIKPQFEIGEEIPNFKGIVKKAEDQLKALTKVNDFAHSIGLSLQSGCYSPIKGPKGNIEFLLKWTDDQINKEVDFKKIVKLAHTELNQ